MIGSKLQSHGHIGIFCYNLQIWGKGNKMMREDGIESNLLCEIKCFNKICIMFIKDLQNEILNHERNEWKSPFPVQTWNIF